MSFRVLLLVSIFVSSTSYAADRVVATSAAMENCTSLSPALLNTTTTCGGSSGVRVRGLNAVTFVFKLIRGGAATAWNCAVQTLDDSFGSFVPAATQNVSAGTITISPMTILRTVSTNDTLQYTLNVNADAVRLVCSGTGATASDTLQVQSRVAFTPDS